MNDTTTDSAEIDRTSTHWSKKASPEDQNRRRFVSWMNHPHVEKKINRKISGDAARNWLEYVKEKWTPQPVARALSLGCGGGGLERHATGINISQEFDAYDVAPGAIAIAKDEAAKLGFGSRIHYDVRDLNTLQLPAAAYDVAFACQSAHHFTAIEHVFRQVRRALKPGGLFILNEFVGPTRFQWTDQQLEVVNGILKTLPRGYRHLVLNPDQIREQLVRPTIKEMIDLDPSEAVRSAELVPLLQVEFDIIERIDYGGTVLQLLLQDIAGNFQPEVEGDMVLLDLICQLEDTLIGQGALPSDFAFIVARPKPTFWRKLLKRDGAINPGC